MKVSPSTSKQAFTLIELLIVVAIIAILAAIAVPNFLEAQTRSKVSRTLADMRTIRTGLETYYVDYNRYPQTDEGTDMFTGGNFVNEHPSIYGLTTPIAYLTSLPSSPFKEQYGSGGSPKLASTYNGFLYVRARVTAPGVNDSDGDDVDDNYELDRNVYLTMGGLMAPAAREAITSSGFWLLKSVGPDNLDDRDSAISSVRPGWAANNARLYDPTNGTVSWGDIVVFSDRPGTGRAN